MQGLDKFKEFFAGYDENFILIGGSACTVLLDEIHLIPFKAKAWCELTDRHNQGEEGLTKHIKKHIKDIAVLLTLIGGSRNIHLEVSVLEDMLRFVDAVQHEVLDVNTTGVKNMSTEYYGKRLKEIYNINLPGPV
jgi:hypothetical protein